MTHTFEPKICRCCGQTENYLLPIDKGTVVILRALAVAIKRKGINTIHPTKEMEVPADMWSEDLAFTQGKLTSVQIGNLTRARAHGLAVRVKDEPGNWCLTAKGLGFLRGEKASRFAIMSKVAKGRAEGSHNDGYWMPEAYTCTVAEFAGSAPYWEGITFEIQQGRVIQAQPKQQALL